MNSDDLEVHQPKVDRVLHQDLMRRVDTTRCGKHSDYPAADCFKCREENHTEQDAARRLRAHCVTHPRYLAADCFGCRQEADIRLARQQAAAVKPSLEKPVETQAATPERVAENLGVQEPVDSPEPVTEPRRRFFQPLPEGRSPEWPKRVDGVSPRNIAMFLTMPEFIYTDYEQNKNNLAKRVFVTADESVNRPAHKLSDDLADSQVQTQGQSEDWSVTSVGGEIQKRAEPIVIHSAAEPPKKIRRKIPAPVELFESLKNAKGIELEQLTVKWNDEHGNLTAKELASARTRQYRKISRLEEEADAYNRAKPIDDPNTGHPAYDVVIPPCPEGSSEVFPRVAIQEYVADAFNRRDYRDWDEWRYVALENQVIDRMYQLNLFRGWPNDRAFATWVLDGRPSFGDKNFSDFYGWTGEGPRHPMDFCALDTTAKDNAITEYRRSEGGYVADDSIRRVGPGTKGGWHVAGQGADKFCD
jgi:hypothetical protein